MSSLIKPLVLKTFACVIAGAIITTAGTALAAEGANPVTRTLFTNARIFDGKSETLTAPMSVLVEDNKIARIAASIPTPSGATVIDAKGRTMTPGFIDAHVHISMQVDYREVSTIDEYYFAFVQEDEARKMLMRGFTTARDVGGNTFSLKRAIDEGRFPGPRFYPSGAVISQTGGHVDYRTPNAIPRPRARDPETMVRVGHAVIADGEAEMLIAAREQLRRGASQVKITAGGGAASPADPLDTVQFSPEEVRAVVRAAQNWNTYVAAHVYNNEGIRMCVENGVKSIEHANFIDEPTLDLVIAKGAWLSVQTLVFVNTPAGMNEGQVARFKEAATGLDDMFKLIKAKGFKRVAFGTDVIGDSALLARQNEEFTNRAKWFSNFEVLRQATSSNAELLAMSGPRNPYPGKLGVIEEGALADILLVNGDPLNDISILTKPEENLVLIMKDGKIYKNTVK